MSPLPLSLRRLFDAHRARNAEPVQDDPRPALVTAPRAGPPIDDDMPAGLREQRLAMIEGVCAKARLDLETAEELAREDGQMPLVAFDLNWIRERLEACAQRARARRAQETGT